MTTATAPAPKKTAKAVVAAPPPKTELLDIPLHLVDVGANVRRDARGPNGEVPADLAELATSIREHGVLQPVRAVGPTDGRYRLVWGQRRFLASEIAGEADPSIRTIPALVEPASDVDAPGAKRSIEQLVENLQRADLNAIDEAVALRAVLDEDKSLTQVALAERLGRSAPWVSNTLRLLETDPVVQDGIRKGTITASHAKSLVVLPADDQRRLAERIEAGLSAHALENEISWKVDALKQREAIAARTEKAIPKAIAALEAAKVGTDVQVLLAYSYNLDNDRVSKAIKKAGWKIGLGSYGRGEESKCDCKAVHLEFERKWQVKPACIDVKHVDRQVNADHVAEDKRRKNVRQRLAALSERIAASLEATPPDDAVVRVLAYRLRQAGPKTGFASIDVKALIPAIADWLAEGMDSTYVYPPDNRPAADKAIEDAIAALPAVERNA